MMLGKCCIQYVIKFGKPSSVHRTGKCQVFFPIPKKGSANECSNYHTTVLISHTGKVMIKHLKARLQQYLNQELSDVQDGFRKGTGIRDQTARIHWIIEKAREFQKKSTSVSLTTQKPLTVWITKAFDCVDHNKLWKILKEMRYQTTSPAS